MILEHIGLSQINGSLVVLDDVKGVQYDEMVELHLDDGSTRVGRVVRVDGDRCVIQVFSFSKPVPYSAFSLPPCSSMIDFPIFQ